MPLPDSVLARNPDFQQHQIEVLKNNHKKVMVFSPVFHSIRKNLYIFILHICGLFHHSILVESVSRLIDFDF